MKEYKISSYIFKERITVRIKAINMDKAIKQFENMNLSDLIKMLKVRDVMRGYSAELTNLAIEI